MAETVVKQLQQIVRDGRTVLDTIHQPSSEVFAIFDQLYLAHRCTRGRQANLSITLHPSGTLAHRRSIGPTTYMRQLVVIDKATDPAGVTRVESLKEEWRKHLKLPRSDSVSMLQSEQQLVTPDESTHSVFWPNSMSSNSFVTGCSARTIHSEPVPFRHRRLDLKGIQTCTGAFFFMVTNQIVVTANPVFVSVPMRLALISREYKAELYHLFSWFLSKNVSELSMQMLLPMGFFVPIYFLTGIGHGFDVFLYLQLHCDRAGIYGLLPGSRRRPIGMVLIMLFMLFGGLFINSDDCPDYFVWTQYISPIKYGYEAVMEIF
ncbi:LOW QUALITY PROTEIN: ABC transporter [Phytophthora megakarya]|uniref:ABC transporter n=1 Tax=Phytophthora megakarya TaxID=4795 RepID=A0A225WPH8_9STRA|nr:LOW QUALITY PROTEIN: ABC transporter [Phytophthora megakarya]